METAADPQFLDLFHIATTSPCRGAGSALYASGTDLDGEPWANPPSMGCDEVVVSNLVGPLSVNSDCLANQFTGQPARFLASPHPGFLSRHHHRSRQPTCTWSFGEWTDYPPISVLARSHQWTNTGDYTVTFTAYNNDNPAGVSTNTADSRDSCQTCRNCNRPCCSTNGFQFQFAGQWNANYTIQYTTNLAPPVTWQTLQTIIWNFTKVSSRSTIPLRQTRRGFIGCWRSDPPSSAPCH